MATAGGRGRAWYRGLADALAERRDAVEGGVAGVHRADHLQQLHELHGVEEMQPHELVCGGMSIPRVRGSERRRNFFSSPGQVRMGGCGGTWAAGGESHGRDGQRRRVGREDGLQTRTKGGTCEPNDRLVTADQKHRTHLGLDERPQRLVKRVLHVLLLDDRLDDQVAVARVRQRRRRRDAAHHLVVLGFHLGGRDLPFRSLLLEHLHQAALDAPHARLQRGVLRLNRENIVAALRCDLRDAVAHQAQTDDAHLLDLAAHRAPLRRRHREKHAFEHVVVTIDTKCSLVGGLDLWCAAGGAAAARAAAVLVGLV